MSTYTAVAHTNIALIKYWGKKDPQLIIPYNSSLSLTLDQFYTKTTVTPATTDQFTLDAQPITGPGLTKMTAFLDILRAYAKTDQKLAVTSTNHVPTAAGLASSASGLAALTVAATAALGLNLPKQTLSRLARRGSGSACRSIYGGFVEWQKGQTDEDSYGVPLNPAETTDLDIAMIALVISDTAKTVSSRQGMANTVATSPFYPAFVQRCEADLTAIKAAIAAKDLQQVGEIAEANALKMHATMLAATPPFSYFLPETLQAIAAIQQLRTQGYLCYFTMDAGPNIKIICAASQSQRIAQALKKLLPKVAMVIAKPGPGAKLI
ncbi:diphosphomevalonate decarboxylase [Agrilactobacillus yilanensis]|uniref:diphosphomevalonate decarboxylase n=1 Tax=Agrilactobacillus yilanensis TaxID=2485997 RepID=A0ABW4J9B1_9LACO|nr:diphosphomevalonate decarboxylase [Agrilactobacillus yilanensis]